MNKGKIVQVIGPVVDVEFLVQLFQLKYGRGRPDLRKPNTWEALEALRSAGLLSEEEHAALRDGYDFLRRVQSRLRIVHNRSVDEAPEAPDELDRWRRQYDLPMQVFGWRGEYQKAGLARNALYLLRPDGYVGLASPVATSEALARYLTARRIRF